MGFWNRRSEEEKAADRLLKTSPEKLAKLQRRIERTNDDLSIKIVSYQRRIQTLVQEGRKAAPPRQKILAQKCKELDRRVTEARRQLKQNLNQLTTVNVAQLLIERGKASGFADEFQQLVGADDPDELHAAVQELIAREDLEQDKRDRLKEIEDIYDTSYAAIEEDDPDKFLEMMRSTATDPAETTTEDHARGEEAFDPMAPPDPVEPEELDPTDETSEREFA